MLYALAVIDDYAPGGSLDFLDSLRLADPDRTLSDFDALDATGSNFKSQRAVGWVLKGLHLVPILVQRSDFNAVCRGKTVSFQLNPVDKDAAGRYDQRLPVERPEH